MKVCTTGLNGDWRRRISTMVREKAGSSMGRA